jgi:hypothetical protein
MWFEVPTASYSYKKEHMVCNHHLNPIRVKGLGFYVVTRALTIYEQQGFTTWQTTGKDDK